MNEHGILLLDKPPGVTSHTAMRMAQRLLGVKKAGHTGSLDPLATGMLPICLGEATKFAQYWLEAGKAYEVRLHLGVTTDTGDSDGAVIATAAVPDIDTADLESLLLQWVGERPQVPPMYAALKHEGKPLYWFARQGIDIPREARMVTLTTVKLLGRDATGFTLFVACSKGTYIRSLVTEIGAALGCGAHVAALRRVWVHPFETYPLTTIAALEAMSDRWSQVYPLSEALAHVPVCAIESAAAAQLYKGQPIAHSVEGRVQLHVDGLFIGMGLGEAGVLRSTRLLATNS